MVLVDYITWHYTIAPHSIWGIMGNYIKAVWHRFLIVQHLKTLFTPWHKRQPSDLAKKGDLTAKMVDSMADFYIRILAVGIRSIIIFTGLASQAAVFLGFVLFFIAWILWPILSIYLIIKGLTLVF